MDWQLIAVAAVVALSAFFVARRFWRGYKGRDAGCGCGGSCACGTTAEHMQNQTRGGCPQASQCAHMPQGLEKP